MTTTPMTPAPEPPAALERPGSLERPAPAGPPRAGRPGAGLGPLGHARRLAPQLRDGAVAIEQRRTLPRQLVGELREAGLFHLMAPASAGGLEAEPRVIVEAIEELSRADAATGWTVMIGQGAGFLAWLDPEVTARIVALHPRPIVVGSMAPTATAQPAGHPGRPRVRVSGRWPYSSGCQIADLIFGAYRCPTAAGAAEAPPAPATAADAGPGGPGPAPVRFALFAADQLRVHDTWRVAGLRGTGSHDLSAAEVEVPQELTFDPFGPARAGGPLYRLPYLSFLMVAMAGFPLGVARRVVEEYQAVAAVKKTTERVLLSHTPLAQADLARCEAAVRAARAGVFEALDRVWAETLAGRASARSRALFTAAVQHAMRTAVEVSDAALRACGASQLYQRAPLQRCYRDLQAAAQHIVFGLAAQRRVGAALLGLEVPAALI